MKREQMRAMETLDSAGEHAIKQPISTYESRGIAVLPTARLWDDGISTAETRACRPRIVACIQRTVRRRSSASS